VSSLNRAIEALSSPPRPPEWYAAQQRLFLETIKPITSLKLHIYSMYMPTIFLDAEGNLVKSAYPDEAQELIAKLDEMIQQVADSWQR
jgi:hypothetical protein